MSLTGVSHALYFELASFAKLDFGVLLPWSVIVIVLFTSVLMYWLP